MTSFIEFMMCPVCLAVRWPLFSACFMWCSWMPGLLLTQYNLLNVFMPMKRAFLFHFLVSAFINSIKAIHFVSYRGKRGDQHEGTNLANVIGCNRVNMCARFLTSPCVLSKGEKLTQFDFFGHNCILPGSACDLAVYSCLWPCSQDLSQCRPHWQNVMYIKIGYKLFCCYKLRLRVQLV